MGMSGEVRGRGSLIEKRWRAELGTCRQGGSTVAPCGGGWGNHPCTVIYKEVTIILSLGNNHIDLKKVRWMQSNEPRYVSEVSQT